MMVFNNHRRALLGFRLLFLPIIGVALLLGPVLAGAGKSYSRRRL